MPSTLPDFQTLTPVDSKSALPDFESLTPVKSPDFDSLTPVSEDDSSNTVISTSSGPVNSGLPIVPVTPQSLSSTPEDDATVNNALDYGGEFGIWNRPQPVAMPDSPKINLIGDDSQPSGFPAAQAKENQFLSGALTTPITNYLPDSIKAEAERKFSQGRPVGSGGAAEGVLRGLGNLAEGFTSPIGIATLGMGELPSTAQRAVSLAFATQMASQIPAVASQLNTEFSKPEQQRDYSKIAQLITEGAANVGFAGLAAAHGLALKNGFPGADVPKTTPEESPEVKQLIQSAAPILPEAAKAAALTGKDLNMPAGAVPPAVKDQTPFVTSEEIQPNQGEQNASTITGPEGSNIQQIRPAMGEGTPLRQQGETAGIQTGESIPSSEPARASNGQKAEVFLKDISGQDFSTVTKPHEAGVKVGLNMTADDVPAIKEAQFQSNEDMKTALANNDSKGFQSAFGKSTLLGGVIEGAERKGPNYDLYQQWLKQSSAAKENIPAPVESVKPITGNTQSGAGDVQQPELIGMGGAVPSEFDRGQGSPTAMKFRQIDAERQQRGLEPLAKPDSVTDQATMDKAMAAVDQNPELPDQLVSELNSKPRPISDVENHVLMLRKIDLRDAYDKSARAAAQAYDDSQDYPDRKADLIAHNIETARLSDKLTDLENASRKSGSERGRALRSLRVMANEDYSLASLETQRRVAKGGAPLTDQERSDLVKVADDYKAANDKLNQHIADRDQRISELESQKSFNRLTNEAKQDPQYHPAIIRIAEKIVASLDRGADAARQRIKERGIRFNAGVDPTVLLDVAQIGASYLGHAVLDFGKWSLKMRDEFGDGIEPYLKGVFEQSQKIINEIKASPAVKRVLTKSDITDKIENAKETITERVKDGDVSNITGQVQKLAREFIKNGVIEREPLIDAVHAVLSNIIPDWTRRQTMDAISGYGDFKQLSKDEISVKLRGLKGEMQQLSKLDDMANNIPPSKTGVERRTPTDAERALIKAVNEAKIKFQVPITDPAKQLKSALDTRKTQLENQIKDYQQRIEDGNFANKPRRDLTLDRTAQELQAEKERVVKGFKTQQRKYQLAQRTGTEKVFDFISNARRFSVLSGVNVLAKLAAYSATKVPSTILIEGVGGLISKLPKISEIADKSPSEGGLQVKALARSVAKVLTQGFIDAYKTAATGQSDLKAAFSPRIESGREWYNFFQTIHEVIKSPLRRQAFELSLSKRMEAAAAKGVDITDPLVQVALAKDAYLDSDRALLLENNKLASGVRGLFKQLETKGKNGKVPLGGKIAATVGRVELPVLTVPLNYIKQTITSAFGLVSGSIKARQAFKEGIDKLTPEEADTIIRHLKYGSVGGALLLYGFYDGYKNGANGTFGGYYQPGEKRKDDQAGVGGIKIEGHKISGLLLHNPLLAVAQLGHTIGAIAASKIRKKSPETHGVPEATIVGLMGLLNDSPMGRTFELASQISDPRSADYAIGEHVKGLVVPQLVNEAAQFGDKDKNGKPIRRNPTGIIQHVESGIPKLRETLPVKH